MEYGEWLGYGAESCCKVARSRLGFAMQRQETSVNPVLNEYHFLIREG